MSSDDPLNALINNCCSFLLTCKTLVETSSGLFCSVCYELCHKAQTPILNVNMNPTGKSCSCTHQEDAYWYEDRCLDCLEGLKSPSFSLNSAIVMNHFFGHSVKGVPILELIDPEVINFMRKDSENLEKGTFKWEDIEIPAIEKRASFTRKFNEEFPDYRRALIDTRPFENLIPLRYLDMITECPDYTFGQPIYNNSLNYNTYLLNYFIGWYLKKDLLFLEKIDAEDIETYSPTARHYIRENNRANPAIRAKYFNESFNLVKFGIKLIEKFVVGASWRWIGGNHKAHVYCQDICRMIIESGIASQEECNQIRNALCLKIQVYKTLEGIIDRDSKTIAKTWVDIWYNGLLRVREDYIEMLINILYFYQDEEVLEMLLRIYKEGRKNPLKSQEQLNSSIRFNRSILFEEEFARKTMEFLLSYILSQNQINGVTITSRKIENIADNFLHIFSNYEDPYLQSLRLLREEDYLNFVREENGEYGPQTYVRKDFLQISEKVTGLLRRVSAGEFLYKIRETQLLKEIEEALEAINAKVGFTKAFEKRSFQNQRLLFISGLPNLLFILAANLMIHHPGVLEGSEGLLNKLRSFLEYYLRDNLEVQSTFFRLENIEILKKIFDYFPGFICELFLNVFKENSQILISKAYILDALLAMFKSLYAKLATAAKISDYNNLTRLIDCLALFLNLSCFKIFSWIPEYDIRILNSLVEMTDLLNPTDIESLLRDYEADKLKETDARLDFLMNFLSLVQISSSFRYINDVYVKLNEKLGIDTLIKLIGLCKNNLNFRSILLEIYGNIHIDFKNQLLNQRMDYYFTKPMDMQYEEDPFYDKEYDKTIDLLIGELRIIIDEAKVLKESHPIDQFVNFVNSAIFGNIVKLMNYFMVIREGDLYFLGHKLNKYIPKLEQLNDFLFSNRLILLSVLGAPEIEEFDSPERKKLDHEMATLDPNLLIKRQRRQILGNCAAVLEMCLKVMAQAPVLYQKRCMMNLKSNTIRANDTYQRTLNFSNRLTIRKNNLQLPMEEVEKQKHKQGKMLITSALCGYYLTFKYAKMSVDIKTNIYIMTLRDESPEMQDYAKNLCAFIHNQLTSEWTFHEKNKKYTLIESLLNALFISTATIQKGMFKIMVPDPANPQNRNTDLLDKLWTEMKVTMSFVRFKTNVDKVWKEAFRRVLILMRFHQFLCEDNFIELKTLMSESILPNDTIDRVQRWTTILQKLSDCCQWHYNYTKGEINDFEMSHRNYLLPLATGVFENLTELCTGPCPQNQKKIHTYIYDRYNGLLRRYWRDPDTEFYKMKSTLIEFILAMAEGNNPDVINYQQTNFELTNLNTIMINSLKQLYYCVGLKDPFTKKKMADYPMGIKDFKAILHFFESNTDFASHTLLKICLKLFSYIKLMGETKNKYILFCKERDDLLLKYELTGKLDVSNISEEDLVTYKFLRRILIKIEILRGEDDKEFLASYHFEVLSKCLYLSEETKREFMREVDRTSQDTKISGLLAHIDFFKIEMENNEKRYNRFFLLYKVFGGGNSYYFELVCLILSFVINILLLVDLQYTGEEILFSPEFKTAVVALGIIEIGLSVAAIIAYFLLSYTLQKKISLKKFQQTHAYKVDLSLLDRLYVKYWVALIGRREIAVFLFHILFVALGLSSTPGLLGIDLFAIIFLIPSMQYVVLSVTEHLSHILSTLALAGLIIYAYSIFVHLYFIDWFTSDLTDQCNNLSHCYWTVLNKAFRNGEGVGGLLNLAYYGTAGGDPRFYGHLFLNISFFLIVNTVLLNIILAVLVDTFSQLRQRSDYFEEDSENRCFICGIEKFKFEKSKIDFDYHVNVDHNVWNYVNFLIFMREKTEKDCNGVEEELYHKIRTGDTSWFPTGRNLRYEQNAELDKRKKKEDKFEVLEEKLKSILTLVKAKNGA